MGQAHILKIDSLPVLDRGNGIGPTVPDDRRPVEDRTFGAGARVDDRVEVADGGGCQVASLIFGARGRGGLQP